MENIDIKALARELKNTAAKEEASKGKASTLSKKVDAHPGEKPGKAATKTKISGGVRSSSFQSMITIANQRNEFMLNHHVYIDADVYDILKQLKGRTRLVIGNLTSLLLEEFILDHKEEIIRLLKQKPNRLMK